MPRPLALLALGALVAGAGLLLGGCHHAPRSTAHLFPEAFTPMGHRGARGLAPENTAAAFDIALKLGIPFELDTMALKGGELVVTHDDTLDRVTSGAGTGPVADATLEQVRALEFGAHFDPSFKGEPIPLLKDVLARYGDKVLINIEVKSLKGSPNDVLAKAVARAVEEAGLAERVIITSFNPFLLELVRLENPDIARGQIYGTFEDADLKPYEKVLLRNLAFNRKAQPDCLIIEGKMLTPRYLKRMQSKGYKMFVWTINEAEEMDRFMEMGVDGIITDFPDVLLERMALRGA